MSKISNKKLRFAVLAADIVPLVINGKELCVRLIRVNRPPHFVNKPGLPGGLLSPTETAEQAALRNVKVKAGIDPKHFYVEQLYTFSEITRDPRGRVVAVAYLALAPWANLSSKDKIDTKDSWWCAINKLPKLAYDHNDIMKVALERLRARITYTTLINKLLPDEFTLMDLENAYNIILGKKVDRRNFRKKILKLKVLIPLGRKIRGLKWRPATLYSFRSKKVAPIDIL